MSKNTARAIAIVVGFVVSSPVGFLLFHKLEPAGWGLDPWLLVGAVVGAPGMVVGSAVAGKNQSAKLAIAFVVCWLFYGAICYLLVSPFRKRT